MKTWCAFTGVNASDIIPLISEPDVPENLRQQTVASQIKALKDNYLVIIHQKNVIVPNYTYTLLFAKDDSSFKGRTSGTNPEHRAREVDIPDDILRALRIAFMT